MIALSPLVLLRRRLYQTETVESPTDANPLRIQLSNVWPAVTLFGYAMFFSLAYIQLDAGVGALILFASVQMTMIGISVAMGNRVTLYEWTGIAISIVGLVYLLMPGLSAPPVLGTVLMILSGISWGVYSLLGKRESNPTLSTSRNFLFCLPGVVVLGLITAGKAAQHGDVHLTSDGIVLAVISGAVASGMGYVLWYLTVRRITTTVASVCQLVVPVFAAIGGILFLDESLSLRLIFSSVLIVGGIVITTVSRKAPDSMPARSAVETTTLRS
jgi:drug/metabolite transporter (DMT)-like permease